MGSTCLTEMSRVKVPSLDTFKKTISVWQCVREMRNQWPNRTPPPPLCSAQTRRMSEDPFLFHKRAANHATAFRHFLFFRSNSGLEKAPALGREKETNWQRNFGNQMASNSRSKGVNGKFTEKQLHNALCAYYFGEKSLRQAAKAYQIPKSTLGTYTKQMTVESVEALRQKRARADAGLLEDEPETVPALKKRIMGHPTTLTAAEELLLVKWILELAFQNIPLTCRILIDLASRILRLRKGVAAVLRGFAELTETWCRGFRGRHPEIALRTPDPLADERNEGCTEDIMAKHMDCLFAVMDNYGLLRCPWRIWNADETGIKLGEVGGKTKVLAARGARRVYCVASSDSRHVSLIFAVSAAGVCSPPSFILPCGKTPKPFWEAIAKLKEDDWATVCEKKGFITEVSFFHWLKLFVQFLDERVRKGNPREHHMLIIDQASAHVSMRIIDYANEHHVLLYVLPPHTTHLTQPVDVGLFGPMKTYYRQGDMS